MKRLFFINVFPNGSIIFDKPPQLFYYYYTKILYNIISSTVVPKNAQLTPPPAITIAGIAHKLIRKYPPINNNNLYHNPFLIFSR